VQNLAVEKHDRMEGLVYGRGGEFAALGKVGEVLIDLGPAVSARILPVVKQDEPLDPERVRLLGARRIVLLAHRA